jgi:hypothetical protein
MHFSMIAVGVRFRIWATTLVDFLDSINFLSWISSSVLHGVPLVIEIHVSCAKVWSGRLLFNILPIKSDEF